MAVFPGAQTGRTSAQRYFLPKSSSQASREWTFPICLAWAKRDASSWSGALQKENPSLVNLGPCTPVAGLVRDPSHQAPCSGTKALLCHPKCGHRQFEQNSKSRTWHRMVPGEFFNRCSRQQHFYDRKHASCTKPGPDVFRHAFGRFASITRCCSDSTSQCHILTSPGASLSWRLVD